MTKWMLAVLITIPIAVPLAAGCSSTEPTDGSTDVSTESENDPSASTSPSTSASPRARVEEFREVVLEEGTPLVLELASSVASDASQVEDAVRASLREAVVVDGREVLSAGTELVGTVTAAEGSGRVKGLARVAFRFSSLTVAGERYDISSATIERVAEATKREDVKKIGVGAGAGAALGALLGGGDGAAKGAALGGAAGAVLVAATKGDEVQLDPGAEVSTKLTAQLVVRVRR